MLLRLTSTNAVNASLYVNLNFNVIHDLMPVARIGGTPRQRFQRPYRRGGRDH